MIELDDALAALVVLLVDGSPVDGFPLDADVAVGAVLSHDADVCVAAALLHEDAALLELNGSRLWRDSAKLLPIVAVALSKYTNGSSTCRLVKDVRKRLHSQSQV